MGPIPSTPAKKLIGYQKYVFAELRNMGRTKAKIRGNDRAEIDKCMKVNIID